MTDKQIIIDYENLCENYSKEVGCYNTFDGSCRFIRPIADDLAFWSLVIFLWSESEYRKPLLEQLEDCIRSFL